MEYTEEMQCSIDIDWFAIDSEGVIVHFASGGGKLPESVALHKEDTEMVSKFFRSLREVDSEVNISPKLPTYISFSSREEESRYLQDFCSMSKRGMFSFDKSSPGDFENINYHLVSYPKDILKLERLPEEIASIVQRTKLKTRASEIFNLSIDEIN